MRFHTAPLGDFRVYCVWLLLLASVIPWRRGTLFDGGLDTVVVLKAVLGVSALGLALSICSKTAERTGGWGVHTHRGSVGSASILFVSTALISGLIGALGSGTTTASAVLAVRLMLVAVTVLVLLARCEKSRAIRLLATASGTICLVAATSGLARFDGRLAGGLPPISPNELALLATVPLLVLVHHPSSTGWRARIGLPVALFAGILLATGSRTGLAAAALGMLLISIQSRRLPFSVAIGAITAAPIAAGIALLGTGTAIAFRGDGADNLGTLNSRTIAWQAALDRPTLGLEWWLGSGLATKRVRVFGQYWDYQVLDSSWISAFVQAGAIGVLVLAGWVAFTVVGVLRRRHALPIALPLLGFLLARSLLENGLLESSSAFVFFFTIAVAVEDRARDASERASTDPDIDTAIAASLPLSPARWRFGAFS